METILAIDPDTFKPIFYERFSFGDVVELIDTRGLRNNKPDKTIFVVEQFCPQIGVPDKIKTTCGCYIYAHRFRLVTTHRFKIKMPT